MANLKFERGSLLRIGTRRSKLAKAQTNWVIGELARLYPDLRIEIVEVVTTGDRILDKTLSEVPGKGLFVKEIEEKLLANEIDLAVHSMKDLPTDFPEGLSLGVVTERVDPRDVLVSRLELDLQKLPTGAKIGTSSLRRKVQLLKCRPELEVVDIRGNIDTRLNKSTTEAYDGILLAAAGLIRMGWDFRIQDYLSCEVMVPAVGQGALGLEIRSEDAATAALISPLNHRETERCVAAERIFLAEMGGGCHTPMGAYCRENQGNINFLALGSTDSGAEMKRVELSGKIEDAADIALRAAAEVKPMAIS